MMLKVLENGAHRAMTHAEFEQHQEASAVVPRRVFKELLKLLIAKGVLTQDDVAAFLAANKRG